MDKKERKTSLELRTKAGLDNNGFVQNEESSDGKEAQTTSPKYMPKPCTVGIEAGDTPELAVEPYAGMPKDVLLQFSSQARYRITREILFWLVIVVSVVLVAATITIIAMSPRCLGWWQTSPIYQIYPRSFKDTDNDGDGDLKGEWLTFEILSTLDRMNQWTGLPEAKRSVRPQAAEPHPGGETAGCHTPVISRQWPC